MKTEVEAHNKIQQEEKRTRRDITLQTSKLFPTTLPNGNLLDQLVAFGIYDDASQSPVKE